MYRPLSWVEEMKHRLDLLAQQAERAEISMTKQLQSLVFYLLQRRTESEKKKIGATLLGDFINLLQKIPHLMRPEDKLAS